jgi:hypothetical protein
MYTGSCGILRGLASLYDPLASSQEVGGGGEGGLLEQMVRTALACISQPWPRS